MNWRRPAMIALLLACVAYGAIIVLFKLNERSLLYFPDPGPLILPADPAGLAVRDIWLTTADSVRLHAWEIAPPPADSSGRWLLLLHGNAGNLATPGRPPHDRQLRDLGLGVLALDYRGYGLSEGAPSEEGLYRDATAAYNYLRDVRGVPADRLLIYGHSLGAAVAIELATRVDAAGLIVEGAFTSAADRGQELYWFLPVHWMVTQRFPSIDRIGGVKMPLLVIHGRDDTTIPISHGRRLFARATGPKQILEVPGGHEDAFEVGRTEYEAGLRRFLATIP